MACVDKYKKTRRDLKGPSKISYFGVRHSKNILIMTEFVDNDILDEVTRLRKTLHRYPELSGHERQTAGWVKAFLEKQGPDRIVENLGGHGLAAIFDSGRPGPTLLFRADLDALPIQEVNDFSHKSQHEGISHKCGHDGHTAILAGVAASFGRDRPERGRVVLLFQAEEETGQGAEKVIKDPLFQEILPDQVFALHNLPGFSRNAVVVREGSFASASKGMIIELNGRSSHAAHPEQGNSPGPMLPELLNGLLAIPGKKDEFREFVLITIIHVRLGEVAFGTNPGKALVMATVRSFLNEDMKTFIRMAESLTGKLAREYGLERKISYTEEFPATCNDRKATDIIRLAAQAAGAKILEIGEPFRWSEDFGHFTHRFPGVLFGLGSGKNQPSLHSNDFDFPDEIIGTGISMFRHISRLVLNSPNDV
jgi:amidohydrolase